MMALTMIFATLAGLQAKTTFQIQAPHRVEEGNQFHVKYILRTDEGQISQPKVPQINGCKLVYGPVVSSQMSSQTIINGKSSSSVSVEFTCTFRADKKGEYTITPATINVGGKNYSTQPTSITIAEATSTPQQGTGTGRQAPDPVTIYDIDSHTSDRNVSGKDVFVRIILSKPTAYENEAIECTIKLYTKYQINEFRPTTLPAFDGFLVEEVPFQAQLNKVENVNGQDYMTALLKKCILFPQKSGKLTINSGVYDLSVVQYDIIDFGMYSVREPHTKSLVINSNSASVNVKSLPAGAPAGFNGAVGHFTASTSLSANSFRTNEPATLTYEIKGTGNIKYIEDPVIDFPAEFEQYTPESTSDAKMNGASVSGTTRIDYTFIPKEVGNYTIGIEPFSYFDPADGQYHTVDLQSYDIKVQKGVEVAPGQRQDVSARNTDILYIHSGVGELSHDHSYIITKSWYWIIYAVMVAALAGTAVYVGASRRRNADVVRSRLSKASKVARRRLNAASQCMKRNDSEQFYAEMLRALWGYLSDKLSIRSSQLTRQSIAAQMTERGASDELAARFIEILDECEMARYTPSGTREKMSNLYESATKAINDLENTRLTKL